MQHRARRQLFRHEADLDEWFYSMRQQAVIDLIALRVLIVNSVLILEDGMEADILESGNPAHPVKIASIIIAQGEVRATGTKHLLPKMREWSGRRRQIHANDFIRAATGPLLRNRRQRYKQKQKKAQHGRTLDHVFRSRYCATGKNASLW